ncbi:hypothetical protein [Marinobacter halodurans]|nr:hypothetical protein [Marinobacter halodurans]
MPITPDTAHRIALLMGAATEAILWGPAREWVQNRNPGSELKCRAGSGQATYHKFDPHSRRHTITYGRQMVMAKFGGASSQGWLSTREIQGRDYFDGEVSTCNLLAHTCCHEFAHLLQNVSGERLHGSVHNAAFYRILDELHASAGAAAVRAFLLEKSRQQGIELPQSIMALVDVRDQMARFAVGDTVQFGHAPRQREGRIIRVNRRTCTVQGTGRWRGARYRVPVSMMRHSR